MKDTQLSEMTNEERTRLVAVFEWLLKEDKKQNPENYQRNSDGEVG